MEKTKSAAGPRLWLAFAGLAFAAGLAVHLPSISGELLWDDEQYLAANSFVADCSNLGQALNPVNLVKVLPVPMSARPVVNASLLLDSCSASGPRGMKVTNALLHGFNAVLVFLIAFTLSASPAASLLGALAFALHPAVPETVHIITFRSHLLGFFFFACGLLAAVFHARKPSAAAGASAVAAYLLAMLSVETAAVLPAVAALAVYFDSGRAGLKRCIPLLAAAVLAAAFFLWFRAPRSGYTVAGSSPGVSEPSVIYPRGIFPAGHVPPAVWSFAPPWDEVYSDRTANVYTMSAVTLRNIVSLHFPFRLSPDYSPHVVQGAAAGLPYLALCLALAGLAARFYARGSLAALGLLIAFMALLPAMNIVTIYNLMADRYLYLPLLGLAVAAAAAGRRAEAASGTYRALGLGAACLWLIWLGAYTVRRGPDFRDSLSLFSAAREAAPRSARAWANLGAVYLRQGDCGKAVPHFEAASAYAPGDHGLRLRLAYAAAWCGHAAMTRSILEDLPPSDDRLYLYGLVLLRERAPCARPLLEAAAQGAPGRRDFRMGMLMAQKELPPGLGEEERRELEAFRKAFSGRLHFLDPKSVKVKEENCTGLKLKLAEGRPIGIPSASSLE